MLARLTTILPAMRLAKALETTRIHRVAGLTGARTAVVTTRPFRAPHHTISDIGLIGGGHVPRLGDVSLAHNGVRFLDEWPECRRHVLEVWRQPLEESVTSIHSSAHRGSRCPSRACGAGPDVHSLARAMLARPDTIPSICRLMGALRRIIVRPLAEPLPK
jgi:hypothetical protein